MSLGFRLTPVLTGVGLGILVESTQCCKLALIPLNPSLFWEKGNRIQSLSAFLGEGLRARAAKLGYTHSNLHYS
ncbi:MAG: hypothetical protein EBV05_08555 [Cyanobacteria bacterium WB6_1B_304]|nr:hypothetical protein [Cyanobacteria bacterium WB6_1B_304]